MDKPYQIILDIWEGNPNLDAAVLRQNGVAGLIVRLNSMLGGHHMDDRFEQNWALAKTFPIQTLYFVYNPWVNGKANFDWLIAHLPADFGRRRIMVDIEVIYNGYSPATYQQEVEDFLNRLTAAGYQHAIYTGSWFLPFVAKWPATSDYWWAAYPTLLTNSKSWAEYKRNLDALSMGAFTSYSPGPVRVWQCSGDGVLLEGFGGRAVDVNAVPGTIEAVAEFFGCTISTGEEEPKPMTDWTKNPIGLYTKTATWTNAAFDFIIGHAGESWNDPNPNLKPIEERAATYNQVFGALWDFDVDFYSYNQYLADEAHWPPEANDQPLQKCIRALTSRSPKFVVVRLNTYTNYQTGKPEDPGYISYAAQVFCGRLSDWLARNKPGCKLVLATSHDWITAHAPNVNNWGYKYATMISQAAANPLVANAYPQETDKVKNYISIRETNEFWWYYDTATVDLILFYLGDRAKFAQWLGEVGSVPDTTPPSAPGNLAATVSNGFVTLAWSPSTGEPVGYQVYRSGAEVVSVVGTSVQLPGVYGPGVYSFGVTAYDASGNESEEATVDVTIIGPEEPEITRAEFDALSARVAELERWRRS